MVCNGDPSLSANIVHSGACACIVLDWYRSNVIHCSMQPFLAQRFKHRRFQLSVGASGSMPKGAGGGSDTLSEGAGGSKS